jgi:hypothetical protein
MYNQSMHAGNAPFRTYLVGADPGEAVREQAWWDGGVNRAGWRPPESGRKQQGRLKARGAGLVGWPPHGSGRQ